MTPPQGFTSIRLVSGTRGQALIEFALIVPVLFVLLVNAVNFGGFLFAFAQWRGA